MSTNSKISYHASFKYGSHNFISTNEYDYGLGCEHCFKVNKNTRKHHFIGHKTTFCKGSIIAVKMKSSSMWEWSLRSSPGLRNIKKYKACTALAGDDTICYRGNCTNPHNPLEQHYWNLELKSQIDIEECRQYLQFERIVSLFRGKFIYICKLCYQSSNGKRLINDTGQCHIHRANLQENKLLAFRHQQGITPIISRPSTFDIHLSRLCKHMTTCYDRKNGVCRFAHSEVELFIWSHCENSVEVYDRLVTWSKQIQLKNGPIASTTVSPVKNSSEREICKSVGSVITPEVVKRRSLYCDYCGIQCRESGELEMHNKTDVHLQTIEFDKGHQWNFRQPPWSDSAENFTRHKDGDQCTFSDVPDAFNFCPVAHSKEELEEWRYRKTWREINKKISSRDPDLEKLFSKQVEFCVEHPGVSIECGDELHQTSEKDRFSTSWKFSIKTTQQIILDAVYLLYHDDRLHFSIKTSSEESRYKDCQMVPGHIVMARKKKKKKKLKSNEYIVNVEFKPSNTGFYTQAVILEFNDDIIVKKDISVEISNGPISNVNELQVTKPMETFARDELTRQLLIRYPQPTRKDYLKAKYDSHFPLNCYNYKSKMHKLIQSEEYSRQLIISRYNTTAKISILNELKGESYVYAQNGELFGQMVIEEDLCEDTDGGRLFLDSVLSVLFRPTNCNDDTEFYRAHIIKMDKFSGRHKNCVFFRFNSEIVVELGLKVEKMIEIDVRFEMDRSVFCRMHYAVDLQQNMDILYPALNRLNCLNWGEVDIKVSSEILQEDQLKAVRHIVAKKTYSPPLVVYGPYGTGKTETLAQATKILLEGQSYRVLICTYTNSAADIYLEKYFLKERKMMTKVLRIYQPDRRINTVPALCIPYSLYSAENGSFSTPTRDDILSKRLIITTVETAMVLTELGLYGEFTHIFIDEAAQSLECQLLMPLSLADEKTCVVLTGDHRQMTPKLYSGDAKKQGLEISLLQRLYNYYSDAFKNQPQNVSMINLFLNRNYRSEIGLLRFISDCFYGGPDNLKWRSRDLGNDTFQPMNFYCVVGIEVQEENSTSFYNEEEATIVAEGVEYMCNHWPASWGPLQPEKIQVVSPYSQQVTLIRSKLRNIRLKNVRVDRMHNIQGKEFRALFISTVRTTNILHTQLINDCLASEEAEIGEYAFLSDRNMLNTAFTRAQSYVAVVGDPYALCSIGQCSDIWRKFIKRCNDLKTLYPIEYENIKYHVREFENSEGGRCLKEKADKKIVTPPAITQRANISQNVWHRGPTLSDIIQGKTLPRGMIQIKKKQTNNSKPEKKKQQKLNTTFKYGKMVEDKPGAVLDNEDYDDWDDFKMKADEIIQKLGEKSVEADNILEEVKSADEKNMAKPVKISYQVREERGHAVLYPVKSTVRKTSRKLLSAKVALSDNEEGDEMDTSDEEGEDFASGTSRRINRYAHKENLRKLVRENPNQYKLCMIEIYGMERKARLINQDSDFTEIEINQSSSKRALEHDLVVVEILTYITQGLKEDDESNKNKRGEVVGILERAVNLRYKVFVCRTDPINTGLMIPVNKNMIPIHNLTLKENDKKHIDGKVVVYDFKRDGTIRFKKYENIDPTNPNGKLFLVRILKFKKGVLFPLGIVFATHDVGDKLQTGMSIIDRQYHIQSKRKLNSVSDDEAYNIPDSDIRGREDFRSKQCFTIDPPESQDLDDALSIEVLENKTCVVGIHIADVSHYVHKDSEFDNSAFKTCTTFYPINAEPIFMLPKSLTTKCSLLPNVDRLTVSIMLYLDSEFKVKDVKVKKSVIKSVRRFNYEEAQNIIEEKQIDPLSTNVLLLYKISDIWRQQRLGRAWAYKNVDFIERYHAQAHVMIAEMMIMANHHVALILKKMFPRSFPIRVQRQPDEKRSEVWKDTHVSEAMNSTTLSSPFCKDNECSGNTRCTCLVDYATDKGIDTENDFAIPLETIEMLTEAADQGNWQLFQYLFLSPESYPQLAAALIDYRLFQGRAYYVCSRQAASPYNKHYDLNLTPYTHFTSPIRRYFDIVVHRMLIAGLTDSESPYTEDELDRIAWKCNAAHKTSQNYEADVFKLHCSLALVKKPLVHFTPIQSVDNNQITVTFPRIKHFKSPEGKIKMGYLAPSCLPEVNEDEQSVMVSWNEKIYDLKMSRVEGDSVVHLQHPKELVPVNGQQWQEMLNAVCQNDIDTTLTGFYNLTRPMVERNTFSWLNDLVGEAVVNNKLVHFIKFVANYKVGRQLKVQMAPVLHRGIFSPKIQLFYLSSHLSICLEHRRDPISCFTEMGSRRASKPKYKDLNEYASLWLPVVSMESVTAAVKGQEHLFLHNVPITWTEEDETITGIFSLPYKFYKERGLDFCSDYICVRYKDLICDMAADVPDEVKAVVDHNEKVTFVCHCKVVKVHTQTVIGNTIDQTGNVTIWIKLQQCSMKFPTELLQTKHGYTLEIIPKSLPQRRIEKTLCDLENTTNSLVVKIALGSQISNTVPASDTEQLMETPFLKQMNELQRRFIKAALEEPFTLIQGPPGTGKTVTGVHLASLFCIRNRNKSVKTHVLYCGPSNKSVDVVAEKLLSLGENCPNFIRVYGERIERMDYPLPREIVPKKNRRHYEISKKEAVKERALHHLIRRETNEFAEEIKVFDAKFQILREYEDTIEQFKSWIAKSFESKQSNEQVGKEKKLDEMFNKLVEYEATLRRFNSDELAEKIRVIDENFQKLRDDENVDTEIDEDIINQYKSKLTKKIKLLNEIFKSLRDEEDNLISQYKSLVSSAKKSELQKTELILTTCNASSGPLLTDTSSLQTDSEKFQTRQVIIDEAAMCTEPESMIPIVAHPGVTNVVLIGDHKQLQPIIMEEKAKNLGLQTSLFERYSDKSSMLQEQYRMHKGIMEFPSLTFYDNQLKCGTKQQRKPVKLNIWPKDRHHPIVLCHIEGEEYSLTVSTEDGSEMSKSNEKEAQCVINAAMRLIQEHGVKKDRIVILSQYRAQCALIKRLFKERKIENMTVSTVVASQGSEWDYVIFSTVRSLPQNQLEMYPSKSWIKRNLGFIADQYQVNVALTRAKLGHVILGNKYLLQCDNVWSDLVKHYENLNAVVDADQFHLTKPTISEL